MTTASVLDEVGAERVRQDEIWGQQDHPSADRLIRDCKPATIAAHYGVPTEPRAKFLCDSRFKVGRPSFASILVEEIAEAIAACADDETKVRAELVQVAAVAVSWIEAIDRRSS